MSASSASPSKQGPMDVTSKKDQPAPLWNEEEFPGLPGSQDSLKQSGIMFVTRDTIKKVAPAPPAPKVKLGLDMAHQGTKPGAASEKPGSKFDVVKNINPKGDIRPLTKAFRKVLGHGPWVDLVVNGNVVATVPKYVFMKVSPAAFDFLSHSPHATAIRYESKFMTAETVARFAEWMQLSTICDRVFSVGCKEGSTHLENLTLAHTARVLGLNNFYVAQITKKYCDIIRCGPLSVDTMVHIIELAYPDNDPIFDCFAHNLLMRHKNRNMKDAMLLKKLTDRFPVLAWKIADIEKQKASAQASAKSAGVFKSGSGAGAGAGVGATRK